MSFPTGLRKNVDNETRVQLLNLLKELEVTVDTPKDMIVDILDVIYPGDLRNEVDTAGLAASTILMKLGIRDQADSGYEEDETFTEKWVPLSVDVLESLMKYGNTLQGLRGNVSLPLYPLTIAAKVTSVVSAYAKVEESEAEQESITNYGLRQKIKKQEIRLIFIRKMLKVYLV